MSPDHRSEIGTSHPTPSVAPALLALRTAEEPAAWEAAGFSVVDGVVMVGPVGIECRGTLHDGPLSLAFDRLHPEGTEHLDGIVWVVASSGPGRGPVAHSNGINGFDHLVIMAPDLTRVRSSLTGACFEIRRERPTTMAGTEVTQLFCFAGDVLLEVVAASDETGPAAGDRPATVWGIALTSTDLDATAAWFGKRIGSPKDAVQSGRRIATVRHREIGIGLPIAVMSAR